MPDDQYNWERMAFKGNKVWMAVDQHKTPVVRNGKVLIKYQLNQDYEYWVHKTNVKSLDQLESRKKSAPRKKPAKSGNAGNGDDRDVIDQVKKELNDDAILIFTDGASSGNPGPSGIGALMIYKDKEKRISRYIGNATNNIAELTAIFEALKAVKNPRMPVRLFTDSTYAAGVLTKGWKAQKNPELIRDIKQLMTRFPDLQLIKVKGHAGVEENEVADRLATGAIKEAGA
ncbi:MAG: ribonuclease H [Thermodesulfobacteriota bacterium]|nr:ribonuclease H [Thermodesulfobacteriota bacterium]